MNKICHVSSYATAIALCLFVTSVEAQTLATGDSRTVSQPTYPAVCQTLSAQFTTAARSSPPSTDDTSRIQAALTSCAGTGKSVVLASSGSNNAFYTDSLAVSGEGLVVNAGVTLYGNNSYASNANLIAITGTNSFLGGTGKIDGRGDLLSNSNKTRLIQSTNATNLILYQITLQQSIFPNLYVQGGNGFTAYQITIRTPATRANADGIDIDSVTNASVIGSSIEAGDDGVAVKSNVGTASNITIKDTKLYGTHGLSVGSIDKNTVENILFTGNYVYGTDLNGNVSGDANAINIKTGPCNLTVKQVSYVNTCITGAKHLIVMATKYNTCSTEGGTNGTPSLSDIIVNGAYSTSSISGAYTSIYGQSTSSPVVAYLAHVSLDATAQSADADATVGLDASNDTPSGSGVTTSTVNISGSVPSCTF